MTYYISKTIKGLSFTQVEEKIIEALKNEGFGVLTEINVKDVFKKKLDLDFRKYKILGACNPHFAHQALEAEDKIGTMLPCNVILQELENGEIEVAAVDPMASMASVENPSLETLSVQVRQKLSNVIEQL
jgi:uncharacterized protein (DUF302 family)